MCKCFRYGFRTEELGTQNQDRALKQMFVAPRAARALPRRLPVNLFLPKLLPLAVLLYHPFLLPPHHLVLWISLGAVRNSYQRPQYYSPPRLNSEGVMVKTPQCLLATHHRSELQARRASILRLLYSSRSKKDGKTPVRTVTWLSHR